METALQRDGQGAGAMAAAPVGGKALLSPGTELGRFRQGWCPAKSPPPVKEPFLPLTEDKVNT